MKLRTILIVVGLLLFMASGCSEEDLELSDAGEVDVVDEADTADTGPGEEESDRVAIDLDDYLTDAPDPGGTVRVYETTDASELIGGEAASGQVGDYILENDRVRFVVQQGDRAMGPCPWGGNIIDTEYRSESFGGDVFGELCLFLNADQTFKPESYEVLRDGSEGAGVLAVTGRTEILDFLNLSTMMNFLLPSLGDQFEMRPDALFDVRITKYFILRPGDLGVRVITRIRNDEDHRLSLLAAYLLTGGGEAAYFNPLSKMGGFGFEPLGLTSINPDSLPFLGLVGDDAATIYLPRPDEELSAHLPIAGSYLTIFNIVAVVLGRTDVLMTLLANRNQLADMPGLLHLEPEEIGEIEHWIYASDGSVSTAIDAIYDELGVATGTIEGVVEDLADHQVVGARVSAIDDQGRTMNQTLTDDQGAYSMRVPAGTYELRARLPGQATYAPATVEVVEGEAASAHTIIGRAGFLQVTVTTADGDPTPARVSLICIDDCPGKATSNEEDVTFHQLPADFAAIEWAGPQGEVRFPAHPGQYRLVVSRGMEWSVWPADTFETGGRLIEITADETTEVEAEIARVLDTSGALSADFHVHAISSMDSTTPEEDRVLSFLTEGVDVIVSTDHDHVADYGPAVDALGASDHIVTIVGTEITTSDLGHFNGFPVTRDPNSRDGGALDWGDGSDHALPPSEIFKWIREHPGDQVVQLNHPDVSFLALSDVLRGITYGDPAQMRVKAPDHDPETGDTGLWDDGFSAMELMNGPDMGRFWGVTRWWLTLIGRGQIQTGTAVTDTHVRYGKNLGGAPRSFVFVDDDKDHPTTFDQAHFVDAINRGEVIGTTGPYIEAVATNHSGQTARIGQTLETQGESVSIQLTLQMPEWITVDRVEMLMNVEEVITEPGDFDTSPIEPTETIDVELTEADLEVVATGDEVHRRYRKVVDLEIETDSDAYVVFLVHGSEDMSPVIPLTDITPFAFTNPIYLDADGGGYDNPHLLEMADTEPLSPEQLHFRTPQLEERPLTPEVLEEHIQRIDVHQCH